MVPLERLCGTGVALALSKEGTEPITDRELRSCTPAVMTRDIVLIHTGWDEKYGADNYYKHPYLAENAAKWLAERRVKLVGIDTPTPEVPRSTRSEDFDYPIHRILLVSRAPEGIPRLPL